MKYHPPAPSFYPPQIFTGGGLGLAGLARPRTAALAQNAPAANLHAVPGSLFDCPINSDGTYGLPSLPYAYNALEPAIDEQTMRLHHDLHFAAYQKGLNTALGELALSRQRNDFPQIQYWENQLAFHGSGYFLHVIFFQNLAPAGSTKPDEALQKLLADEFGGFNAFKAQLSAAANAVEGSGWAILGWQPFGRTLLILLAEKHQILTQGGVVPLLALDVWEHAYYLKYHNVRADYVKAWWEVVNWANVGQRIDAARGELFAEGEMAGKK